LRRSTRSASRFTTLISTSGLRRTSSLRLLSASRAASSLSLHAKHHTESLGLAQSHLHTSAYRGFPQSQLEAVGQNLSASRYRRAFDAESRQPFFESLISMVTISLFILRSINTFYTSLGHGPGNYKIKKHLDNLNGRQASLCVSNTLSVK